MGIARWAKHTGAPPSHQDHAEQYDTNERQVGQARWKTEPQVAVGDILGSGSFGPRADRRSGFAFCITPVLAMYYQYFGLRKNPFSMSPDPGFLFLTPQHREALAGLTYALLGQKGFLVLTGDAGTGKTTLLTRVLQHLPANRIQASLVLNPILTESEFLEMTLLDFGVMEVPASKAQRLARLQRVLHEADEQKK